ncbi:MAG: DUF1934 domain-containing protein [Ruminococcaceae bacterium]|nr:DUF1934 domain-containing protein [Oscillospiraceae bacterium]
MTKREVMIHMLVSRLELGASLFDDEEVTGEEEEERPAFDPSAMLGEMLGEMPEPDEMLMEGRLVTNERRVELIYEESELTGMEGSVTAIGFQRSCPELVSMMRTGQVRTALTFEEGKRHYCLYNTPYSDFEVCVRALKVDNRLLRDGELALDYLIEIHGARAEHCRMTISVKDRV